MSFAPPTSVKKPLSPKPVGIEKGGDDNDIGLHAQRIVWLEECEKPSKAFLSMSTPLAWSRSIRVTSVRDCMAEVVKGEVVLVVVAELTAARTKLRVETSINLPQLKKCIDAYSKAIIVATCYVADELPADFIKRAIHKHHGKGIAFIHLGSHYVRTFCSGRTFNYNCSVQYDRHFGTHEIGTGDRYSNYGSPLHQGRLSSSAADLGHIIANSVNKYTPLNSTFLITEPSHGDDKHRHALGNVLKKLKVNDYYSVSRESLALHSCVESNGMVVTVGYTYTRVVPIINGNPLIQYTRCTARNNTVRNILSQIIADDKRYERGANSKPTVPLILQKKASDELFALIGKNPFTRPDLTQLNSWDYYGKRKKCLDAYIEHVKELADKNDLKLPGDMLWVYTEPYFRKKNTLTTCFGASEYQYSYTAVTPTADETLPEMVRNCIESLPSDLWSKVCSTIVLDGPGGSIPGMKERLDSELWTDVKVDDHRIFSDKNMTYDHVACKILDDTVDNGIVELSTKGKMIQVNMKQKTVTYLRNNLQYPLRISDPKEQHAFTPGPRYHGLSYEVIAIIIDYLGPLNAYNTTHSTTTALDCKGKTEDQVMLGAQRIVRTVRNSVYSGHPESDRGLKNLINLSKCSTRKPVRVSSSS